MAGKSRPVERFEALTSAVPALRDDSARRVIVDHVRPVVDDGRFPIKRVVGETVAVVADLFADGHDMLAARVRHRAAPSFTLQASGVATPDAPRTPPVDEPPWAEVSMRLASPGTDAWTAEFVVHEVGWHEYSVVASMNRFATWRRDLRLKVEAGQDVSVELLEGSMLIREASARADRIAATTPDANWLLTQADALTDSSPLDDRFDIAFSPALFEKMTAYADRSRATTSRWLPAWVDRERARFGAWYEMFPRSAGPDPSRSGTFHEASERLSEIAGLGFDVVYLPPIHPIGRSFRKGRNNRLTAEPDDPGSPWAIGSRFGGHTAVDPGLGTLADFDLFRAEAERLGLEIALDLAFQCSPDHPWVHEHPEWFRHRPDGTIKYAENPPKKYQDIYPLDFSSEDWRSLWVELLAVTEFWIDRGVKIFRVDNPHTKIFGFWEWLIDEVHRQYPEVVFLSEAFTRPQPMRYLAKAGFSQSYTYFTWRNTRDDLINHLTELTATDVREYLRPNLFVNTPDILHAYLQTGGRPAFQARLLLAATLGASYGIYSGFELCEAQAVAGTEEYADSEKYEFRKRDWNAPGNLNELIARVNQIRHQQPALHSNRTLRFHGTDNPELIAYSKSAANLIFVVVSLDPHFMQHGFVQVPLDAIGVQPTDWYQVRDLLDDVTYTWRGEWNYVRLDPGVRQGHIFAIEPRAPSPETRSYGR